MKKQLWIWPILAVLLLVVIGWTANSAIERTIKQGLRSQIQTLVRVERAMLETWFATQELNAESLANAPQVRSAVAELLQLPHPPSASTESTDASSSTTLAAETRLAQELGPGMTHRFVSYLVADKRQRIIAASEPELMGRVVTRYEAFLTRALDGETVVSAPFSSVVQLRGDSGETRSDTPTMFVVAPIRDSNFQVIAVLALRIRPEREFTRVLQVGQMGASGETLAFDKNGLMVSNSRFDEDLILLGILTDNEAARSILSVSLRDPGGNMKQGFRPKIRRAELPLIKIVTEAIAGKSGVLMDSYSDYRGVPSVGAYEWLPKYGIGLLTEIDVAEAFQPLGILRRTFYGLYGLLAISSLSIFLFTLTVARMQRKAQKAAVEARQLGQYRLESKIGAGAMGTVYKGQHAMLRRPTAVKMLNVDKVNDASIQRFEREVQITCKLNNPNTIAIYDYGRTPEGVFYYAMEFLDGVDLQMLVERYGPQPEGRVIDILTKICESLSEAHALGLVHRDVKPANVMLNRRGGKVDVVKVLDFGLVRALDEEKRARQSAGMTGTPLYMSPEAILTPDLVDARSDLYALGGVGYFLLTGQPLFTATSLVELCQMHAMSIPESPSSRLGSSVSPELESALMACVEKNSARRPQTARDLAAMLARALSAGSWTVADAEAWWGSHERGQGVETRQAAEQQVANSRKAVTEHDTSPETLQNASPSTRASFDRTLES